MSDQTNASTKYDTVYSPAVTPTSKPSIFALKAGQICDAEWEKDKANYLEGIGDMHLDTSICHPEFYSGSHHSVHGRPDRGGLYFLLRMFHWQNSYLYFDREVLKVIKNLDDGQSKVDPGSDCDSARSNQATAELESRRALACDVVSLTSTSTGSSVDPQMEIAKHQYVDLMEERFWDVLRRQYRHASGSRTGTSGGPNGTGGSGSELRKRKAMGGDDDDGREDENSNERKEKSIRC